MSEMKYITELEMTCWACPSQWEGRLEDGRELYVRYRWGTLRVDVDGETVFEKNHGDSFDGCLSTEEMLALTCLRLADGVRCEKEF